MQGLSGIFLVSCGQLFPIPSEISTCPEHIYEVQGSFCQDKRDGRGAFRARDGVGCDAVNAARYVFPHTPVQPNASDTVPGIGPRRSAVRHRWLYGAGHCGSVGHDHEAGGSATSAGAELMEGGKK